MNNTIQKGEIIDHGPSTQIDVVTPSFFGVLRDGLAYRSIVYLLILFPISVGIFVYSITMFSLSIGLAITIFGLPLAYLFLRSLPYLTSFQAVVASTILDVPMTRVQINTYQGSFIDKFISTFKDTQVQTSFLLSILLFPFGIFGFVVVVTSLSVSVSLMAVALFPLIERLLNNSGIDTSDWLQLGPFEFIPDYIAIISIAVIGFFLFIISLHLMRFLAISHAKITNYIVT